MPAFIRSGANLPVHRTHGSVGAQRLANEGSGEDFSDLDLSPVDPGSGDDRFLWQEREGEPTGGSWDDRRRWDELFETQNSTTLQGKRDDRHEQLMNSIAGDAQPTRDQMLEVRRRLDVEMPYQFGPPFGIEPYPQLLPGETGRTEGAGRGGGGAATALAVGARALAATAPVATAAETGRATEALRHIAAQAHEHHRLRGDHQGSLTELIDERFKLERRMRWEVLDAMRDAAQAEGAAQDHVVALSDDQIAHIRAAVDVEIPLDVPYPQYLENEVMHLSVAGQLDGALPARGTAPATGTGAAATHAPGTPGTGTPATTPTAGAAGAEHALAGILSYAREHAGHAQAGHLSGHDWLEIYQIRFDLERGLRRQVLEAKVADAVQAGSEVGMTIHLDQNELDQIHQVIDIAHPVNLENPSYLDTDENLSHQITDTDVTQAGRQAQLAHDASGHRAWHRCDGPRGTGDTDRARHSDHAGDHRHRYGGRGPRRRSGAGTEPFSRCGRARNGPRRSAGRDASRR